MKNPLKTLTKLLKRSPKNDLIQLLYTQAINQPLFIHPALGEMVIQGYLQNTPDQLHGEPGDRSLSQKENNIGVLDISGALVAHTTVGPSGSGPLSYEEISDDFDAMMDDPRIDTIIGRFDTPGGAASQNMDLSDKIFRARGKGKQLIAMVDDRAYSAGFAIASAFDQIWVTRTSGVGSVGVVSFHVDQSGFNEKQGVKIEYIYAGSKKIAGNPHEALTEEARTEFQGEVNRLYDLFTQTVARNLGMDLKEVKATEAGSFYGEAAITAGFAHRMGTFNELIASLVDGKTIEEGTKQMAENTLDPKDFKFDPMTGQEIIKKAKYDAYTGELLQEEGDDNGSKEAGQGPTDDGSGTAGSENTGNLDGSGDTSAGKGSDDNASGNGESNQSVLQVEADQEIKESTIRGLCAAARIPESADDFIKSGMEIDEIKMELENYRAGEGGKIVSAKKPTLVVHDKEASQQGWAKAFQKANR
ncbi:MAG: hypothetical protein GQ468_00910 [Candidatus Scalindua sp.]|nr:hypothetical protein [Candidatus Scalindua sp.]